jgi:N-acetyl-alpha-D-glucosaminyl L-malate synthase BshA
MKIGIVCYPTFGGSGVVATELGKALADLGHEVHFITYSQPIRLDFFNANIFYHEVDIAPYPLFQFPLYETALASKMVDVVRYEQLDVLHVHYAIPHASVAYLAKQILKTFNIHIPVITTLHGTDITLVGKNASYEQVVTFSINGSDGVTCVSNSLKKDTYAQFNIEKDIQVIYNFIDKNRFKRQQKEHFRKAIAPKGEKILIHTSNFRKVKRIEDIMQVFKELRKIMPVKLLLVGDGPERTRIEMMCRELGTCEDVRFLGKLEAIEEVLSVSDVFMMPSEKESFGLAALEAMACEVPVISSNAGGLPELNIHGETGFLSEVGDVKSMLQNTITLLQNENLEQFRKNARQRAELFSTDNIVRQYENFYEKIIKQQKVVVNASL